MAVEIFECSNSDYMKIARAITDFNLSFLPANSSENMGSLAFVLKDNGKIVGGITGKLLLGNCLNIEILWVEEPQRKKGHGTQLLRAIEEAAKILRSPLAQVDTFDFQALEFYKKNGYELFGTLEGCPSEGHKRYYLSRKL